MEDTSIGDESANRASLQCSTPSKTFDESSNDSMSLVIISPSTKRKRSVEIDMEMDQELEDDIEKALETKQRRNNLTVKNVKSILKYVIENENVLAMINNSMKESGLDVEPTITRSKARQLREESQIMWPLSPITPADEIIVDPASEKEHLVLISEELQEEDDDDEYRPTLDDLQEPSDDESGVHSFTNSSFEQAAGRYLESFDPRLLDDSIHESSVTSAFDPAFLEFKKPKNPESIGQRTRSKFSLSSTPLEAIEQAFEPPDITTDMYDFKCDNREWENFLKEFMQPLPKDGPEIDEDDDPEYNAMADEELIDKEELRRDRAVKVPRAEVRRLMEELAGCAEADEASSEDEEQRPPHPPPIQVQAEEEVVQETFVSVESEEEIGMTSTQLDILTQQLQIHIQFITQNFIQVLGHPHLGSHAQDQKIMLAELMELSKFGQTVRVCNLKRSFLLITEWEKFFNKNGASIVKHMAAESELARKMRKKKKLYTPTFHLYTMKLISNSNMFMYPQLLPHQPFRSDGKLHSEFLRSEDHLVAIGLEQFIPYVRKYPPSVWLGEKKRGDRLNAADMIHKYIMPTRDTMHINNRIRVAHVKAGNPIWHYYSYGFAPPTTHDLQSVKPSPPKSQSVHLLPRCWAEFIKQDKKK